MAAYAKLRTVELPDKTATYTPIPHSDVITKVKEQIIKSGFIISGENYNCSGDGKIGVGTFGIVFQEDPDITLGLSFLNSYNKTYAFRVNMGGQIKGSNIPFQLNDTTLGQFKRLHTGAADVMSSDKISEMIRNADEIWKKLYEHKEYLKSKLIQREKALSMVVDLFLQDKLTTFQLNFIKKDINQIIPKGVDAVNAWTFYKTLLAGVSEAHPTTWINDMVHVHGEVMAANGYHEPVPDLPNLAEIDFEEESEEESDLYPVNVPLTQEQIKDLMDNLLTGRNDSEEIEVKANPEEFDEEAFDGDSNYEDDLDALEAELDEAYSEEYEPEGAVFQE